jgi:hypothetical protein
VPGRVDASRAGSAARARRCRCLTGSSEQKRQCSRNNSAASAASGPGFTCREPV